MFQDTQWFVPGSYGGEGGVYFTDWWSSPDHSRYFPTRPPQQVSVTYRWSVNQEKQIKFMKFPNRPPQ